MKTKLIVLLPFLLLGGVVWGQNKKASIKRLKLFQNTDKIQRDIKGNIEKKDSTALQPTLFWAQYDATRRGSMLYIDKNQRVRTLSENPPDAAIQSITDITAKIKGLKGDVGEAEAAFKAQKSIAEMGKRTAAVNMLRDALYRLNELYYATADEKKDILELLKDYDVNKINALNNLPTTTSSTTLLKTNVSDSDLNKLFEKIIESVKHIAIQEAQTDVHKYQADKAEYEALTKKAELGIKEYETWLSIIQKIEGNLTKEAADEYLKKLIKQTK